MIYLTIYLVIGMLLSYRLHIVKPNHSKFNHFIVITLWPYLYIKGVIIVRRQIKMIRIENNLRRYFTLLNKEFGEPDKLDESNVESDFKFDPAINYTLDGHYLYPSKPKSMMFDVDGTLREWWYRSFVGMPPVEMSAPKGKYTNYILKEKILYKKVNESLIKVGYVEVLQTSKGYPPIKSLVIENYV